MSALRRTTAALERDDAGTIRRSVRRRIQLTASRRTAIRYERRVLRWIALADDAGNWREDGGHGRGAAAGGGRVGGRRETRWACARRCGASNEPTFARCSLCGLEGASLGRRAQARMSSEQALRDLFVRMYMDSLYSQGYDGYGDGEDEDDDDPYGYYDDDDEDEDEDEDEEDDEDEFIDSFLEGDGVTLAYVACLEHTFEVCTHVGRGPLSFRVRRTDGGAPVDASDALCPPPLPSAQAVPPAHPPSLRFLALRAAAVPNRLVPSLPNRLVLSDPDRFVPSESVFVSPGWTCRTRKRMTTA